MNVYQTVTDRIINDLKKGNIPWKKPWVGSTGAVSHVNGKPYSLLNQFLLGCSGEWLTYNQIAKEGGRIKNGEKASIVVFYKILEKKTDEIDDEDEDTIKIKKIPFLKYINVFNVNQCEGIKAKYTYEEVNTEIKPDEKAEKTFTDYVTREGITVNKDGDKAFYRPGDDSITVPAIEKFYNVAEYYSTLFHEAIHSTGVEKRLNRGEVVKATFFGSNDYSKEELVAEVGASMLTNIMGLNTESSDKNNAAYIQSWLKALENDNRLIVSASGKAEKAVKYIMGEEVTA